jgi:hypothetical protein
MVTLLSALTLRPSVRFAGNWAKRTTCGLWSMLAGSRWPAGKRRIHQATPVHAETLVSQSHPFLGMSHQTIGIGARPSGVPGAAVAMADRTAGRQIGGAFGRRPSIQDKNIGFQGNRDLTVSVPSDENDRRIAVCSLGGRDLCRLRTSRFLLGSLSPECATTTPKRATAVGRTVAGYAPRSRPG